MPPRLLPEEDGYGFVDTVHTGKVASVWTTNKFCNQLGGLSYSIFAALECSGFFHITRSGGLRQTVE